MNENALKGSLRRLSCSFFFWKKRNPEAGVISSWAVTNILTKLSGSQGNTIRKSVTRKFRKKYKIICAPSEHLPKMNLSRRILMIT